MSFTNLTRNSASYSNESRTSASFTAQTKSDSTTYGELSNDVLGNLSNDDLLRNIPVGDWENDDPLSSTFWTNETRN